MTSSTSTKATNMREGNTQLPTPASFPDGMRPLGDVVRHLGLTFGVWTAPFEVSERAWVYHNHPDWLVHNASGKPVHLGHVTENKDQLYALDPTNPGAQEYLRQTYATLVNDWGVRYIKTDFMDDSCVEGATIVQTQLPWKRSASGWESSAKPWGTPYCSIRTAAPCSTPWATSMRGAYPWTPATPSMPAAKQRPASRPVTT